MKNFTRFLFGAMLAGSVSMANAQGTRNNVLMETFTGTWCQYCPGAAMAIDEMILAGKKIAPVKDHIGDNYETTESAARDTYYAVGGYPTTWFDGKDDYAGGSTNSSIYATYLPFYNTAIAAATPFNITVTSSVASNNLTVNYSVEQVGTYSAGNLVVHAAVTERHIPDSWLGGLTEVDFVMRKMIPDQNGTALTITQGNTVSNTLNLALNTSWVQSNLELVVWVQNTTTKEVFNTYRGPLSPSTYGVDPAIANFLNPIVGQSCEGSITPEIVIFNNGNTTLTSLTINYTLNGTPGTYNWSGNLPYYTYAVATLPTLTFTPQASNSLSFSVSNPNSGATDENSANNSLTTYTWANVSTMDQTGMYRLELQLDNYGSETTWEFIDANGTVVASGGPYANSSSLPPLITENVNLPLAGCTRFRINDSFGDGICCQYGAGYFNLYNPGNQVILAGGAFGDGAAKDWVTDPQAVSVANQMNDEVSIYPNPTSGQYAVALGTNVEGQSTLTLMTLEGKTLSQVKVSGDTFKGNLGDLAAGMYLMKVENSNGVAIKKITKE